jgi:serpin B
MKPEKPKTWIKKIQASGLAFFDEKTKHLAFTLPLNQPKPLWRKFLWMAPSIGAVTVTITVLVSILIGATQPQTSFDQAFTGIVALNQVSYPPLDQREKADVYEDGYPEYETLTNQVNSFYRQTAEVLFASDKNLAYAPFSAYVALALLLEAADGSTEAALASLLGVSDLLALRQAYEHAFIDTFLETTQIIDNQPIVVAKSMAANGVFVREDIPVNPDYLHVLGSQYFAEIFHTAFDQAGQADISRWLNQKTFNFLNIKPEALGINQETVLSLFNTFYLKANWEKPFLASANTLQSFTNQMTGTIIPNVTFMHKTTKPTLYVDQPNFTIGIDHAYGGHRLVYVLPKGALTPKDLLSPTWFPYVQAAIQSPVQDVTLALSLPKVSTHGKLDLKQTLTSVAPDTALLFDPQTADLSKALPNAYVQSLTQHIRLDFLEAGVQAAAITQANVGVTATPTLPTQALVLDRSFLYLVVNAQGLILFSGVIHEPGVG